MKHSLKLTVLCPLLLCLLLFAECGSASNNVPVLSKSDSQIESSYPTNTESLSASTPESSGFSEAPIYYFDESHGEDCLAQITEDGILLPDGRIVTKEGVLLPDGTMLYEDAAPFRFLAEDLTEPETVLTLPDGTRIVATTYFVGGPYRDELKAYPTDDGNGLLLPDGRIVTKEGVLLPDGTMLYEDAAPLRFIREKPGDMEGLLILPDGTRIIHSYF